MSTLNLLRDDVKSSREPRVHRSPKDREHPFSRIAMEILKDQRLSAEDIGTLAYFLGKPDDWQPRVRDLQRRFRWGRDKAGKVLRRLKDFGYVRMEAERGGDGRFTCGALHIHESPRPSAVHRRLFQ